MTAVVIINIAEMLTPTEAAEWAALHSKEMDQAMPLIGRGFAANPGAKVRIGGAKLLGLMGLWEEAWPVVERLLASEDDTREAADQPSEFFIDAAAAGRVDDAPKLLEEAPNKVLFEPIATALRQLAGRPVHAPPEVLEVASDLIELIQQRRKERTRAKSGEVRTSRKQPPGSAKGRSAGKGHAAAER